MSAQVPRPRGGLRLSAAAGLIAGTAFGGAQLSMQLLTGAPSLPSLLQDRLFATLPGAVTSTLIDRLQFWAKPLALVGIVTAQAIAVALLALLLTRAREGRHGAERAPALTHGALLTLLLWLIPELLLLPAAGLGLLGVGVEGSAASALATALAAVLAGVVYTALRRLWAARPATAPAGAALSRRRLVAAGLTSLVAGGAGVALLRTIAAIGEQSSAPAESVAAEPATAGGAPAAEAASFAAPPGISAEITPNTSFYVISKNFVDPTLTAGGWSLQIKGLVDNPLRLSHSELMALPTGDVFATLECVSNGIGGDLIGNTRWTGVPLATLLQRAGVRSNATWVVFGSADGYVESLPLSVVELPTTLLAHSMDGSPLPSKHGFPARVITAGNYGMKNPKWLTSIELATQPGNGYWEHEGWNVDAGVRTMARFDTHPHQVPHNAPVRLGGVAFAGDRSISRVEVSTDGGRTWTAAAVERPSSPATWVRWSIIWTPDQAGHAILAVRAVDGKGMPQIADKHVPFPSGATGYHTIQVQVVAPAS